jgi:two-component system, NarL family, sensor histidine kinase DegS
MALEKISPSNRTEEFEQTIQSELEQAHRALNEINMMLDQSQSELSKLTQRNSAITGHLQQVQAQMETLPRADIRTAFNAALDAQQRLLVMRGQMDKLQSDQTSLTHFIQTLETVDTFISKGFEPLNAEQKGNGGTASLEMVINAQEAERQRLSRQMHDGPAQALSNFIVQTEIAARFFDIDANRAKEELNNLKISAMSTFQKVRQFIYELRPMMLDDLGLFPTIRRYVETFKEQSGYDVNLTIKGTEKRLEPYIEVMIFRGIQELMGNVARHNGDQPVKVQINVQVSIDDNQVKVVVGDNGKGFDPNTLGESSGLGLKLIKDRTELLGGFFNIESAVGQGCHITFQVPYQETKSPPFKM